MGGVVNVVTAFVAIVACSWVVAACSWVVAACIFLVISVIIFVIPFIILVIILIIIVVIIVILTFGGSNIIITTIKFFVVVIFFGVRVVTSVFLVGVEAKDNFKVLLIARSNVRTRLRILGIRLSDFLFESPEDIIFWIKLFLYNLIEFE
jgi:hypothetical protein